MNLKKIMTWSEIEKEFNHEWVELVDCDWPEEEIHPRSGTVRVHSKSRNEFYEHVLKLPPVDSSILFVGKRKLPTDVIFSPGFRRVVPNNA